MKPLPLLFLLTALTASLSFGQGLIILDEADNDITGDTLHVLGNANENIIKAQMFFHNASDEDMQLLVRKIEIDILEGTHNAFCWIGFCFTPEVYEVTEHITLGPGETSGKDDFYAEYYPGGHVGTSIISYEFFSREEGFDEVLTTLVFETEDATNVHMVSGDNQVQITVHPNPASSTAVFSHNLGKAPGNAVLTIRNTNGAIVQRFPVDLQNDTVTLDVSSYPDGLYLYDLATDTGQTSSGKLMISK